MSVRASQRLDEMRYYDITRRARKVDASRSMNDVCSMNDVLLSTFACITNNRIIAKQDNTAQLCNVRNNRQVLKDPCY